MEILIFFIVPCGVLAIWVAIQYNGLVGLRNHVRESWSNIDTELKRRYDLIPNLVNTVKAYATHEETVLTRVIELRNRCVRNHGDVDSQAGDERALVGAVGQLLAVAENYPELKAQKNFLSLQEELVNTENRIQAARRFFNGNVRDYRNRLQQFPSNLVANLFNFRPEAFFDVEPCVREVPSSRF